MGLLDRVGLGRPKKEVDDDAPSTSDAAKGGAQLPPPSPQARVEEALRDDAASSSALLSAASMSMPSGGRLYNPYEGLGTQVGAKPHAFRLPEGPEFVFEEEATVRRRDWTQHLQFYCGGGYLLGGGVGVASGLYKYATEKPEIITDSLKLKANRLLNATGSFAKPFSNSCGVLGLYFSGFESFYVFQFEKYGVPDSASTLLAGFTSGALFRAPRGPRQATVAGAVGVVVAGGLLGLRTFFPAL